jgi:uncharacterized sulfatase
MPHLSQGQFIGTQFLIPTTAAWYALFQEGKLNEAQSIFWQTPKAPEELYDLRTDPDEVTNLANSPAHRAILEELRRAHRQHTEKIRDICLLPEGEMHARSAGSTPYDIAQDDSKYPFKRIFHAAELASNLDPAATPQLKKMLKDKDSAVRYWAVMGFLMRGTDAVNMGKTRLRKSIQDQSPYVRIAAAQALAQHGSDADLKSALSVLESLLTPTKTGS